MILPTREQIVDIMRAEGFDAITAAEHATRAIEEFRASGKESETYTVGSSRFTLTRQR